MIEVELRGFLAEGDFHAKLVALKETCDSFSEDHRDTVFFMISGMTLKVARLESQVQAKVTLKLGDIVSTKGQREFELPIAYADADTAVEIFKQLGFTSIQQTHQTRYNLTFGQIELSLKWSVDWSYHFEVEKLVSRDEEIPSAEADLRAFCNDQDLRPMTDDEFERFRTRIDRSASHQRR